MSYVYKSSLNYIPTVDRFSFYHIYSPLIGDKFTLMKNLYIVLFCLCLSCSVKAQFYDFGLGLGVSGYTGDLDTESLSDNVKNVNLAGQLFFRYHINQRIAVKGSLMIGSIDAADSLSTRDWQQLRNLSFRSNLTEFGLMGEFNVLKFNPFKSGNKFTAYATAGFTYVHFDPTTEYRGVEVNLQPLGTEGQGIDGFDDKYSLNAFSLAFGGGIKFMITDNLMLGGEAIMRRAGSDYLDDVSGSYVNYDELRAGNGELAAALGNRQGEALGLSEPVLLPTGTIRGMSDIKDYFGTIMITLSYAFDSAGGFGSGSKYGCPTFD